MLISYDVTDDLDWITMGPVEFNESPNFLELFNKDLMFKFNRSEGTYDIIDAGTTEEILDRNFYEIRFLKEAKLITVSSKGISNWEWNVEDISNEIGQGKSLIISQTGDYFHVLFKITLYNERKGIFFQLKLKEIKEPRINLVALKLLVYHGETHVKGSHKNHRILRNAWQSWSPIELVDLKFKEPRSNLKVERRDKHSLEKKPKKGQILSDFFTLLTNNQTRTQLFLGYITLADQLGQFKWLIEGRKQVARLEAVCYGDSILLEKDEEFTSEILMISHRAGLRPLEDWAAITGTMMKARKFTEVPVGWCSWYQYWKNIDEEKIYTNLEAAKQLRDQIPLEYFQIDDGYEPGNALGDWLESDPKKFPKGLKDLASRITTAGFKPGIWLAPFVVSNTSKLFRDHPDWLVRTKTGKLIWGTWPFLGSRSVLHGIFVDRVLALDLTHPEVQDWLKQTIEALIKDFGFKYLKIDFIYAGAIEAVRHNPKMTRIQAFRKGIEIIREAAGNNTFILGCGAPFGPCIGVVDAMRVSTDTAPTFKVPFILRFMNKFMFANLETIPSLENASQQNLLRYGFHEYLWINDPDTLIIRHESKLSPDEIRFEVTVMGLLGGLLFISDNLAKLTPAEIDLFRLLIPPSGNTALPLDMLKHNYPELLLLDIETPFDKWKLLGLLNWSDDPKPHKIDLNRIFEVQNTKYHIFEFWTQEYLGIHEHSFEHPQIAPHSAALLAIHEVKDIPTLLSSSFHITQGGSELKQFDFNPDLQSLKITVEKFGKSRGTLHIFLPEPYQNSPLEIEGPYLSKELRDGLLILELEFTDTAELVIEFIQP